MAQPRSARSLLATVVGYVLLALIAYFLLRVFVGTIFWLIRTILVIAVLGGLFALYVKLKVPKD
jgi:hypothetical protein